MATNAAILAASALSISALGVGTFLAVYFPVVLLSAEIGVWLFFVQHQFENTHWSDDDKWSARDAALYGSSFYELPAILNWFTANIGIHHLHHLSSRIPFYRLPEVLRDHSELRPLRRLTLQDSFRCRRLALWDEKRGRLVTFADLGESTPAAVAGSTLCVSGPSVR
jgi:omega-6 fatty acid desaturase (delta-12 desaturase)